MSAAPSDFDGNDAKSHQITAVWKTLDEYNWTQTRGPHSQGPLSIYELFQDKRAPEDAGCFAIYWSSL